MIGSELLSRYTDGRDMSKLDKFLQLAEAARQNPCLLKNHFENRVPQRLTSHLAGLMEMQGVYEGLRGSELWDQLGADEHLADIGEEVIQVKRALTAYVPEVAELVNGGVR